MSPTAKKRAVLIGLLLLKARKNQPDVLRLLLQKGANVTIKNSDGVTPLTLAKRSGNKDIVRLLRQAGAQD